MHSLESPQPAAGDGFSRKPLDATVDRGTAVRLFAQEAEYYQDITFAATKTQPGFRMIVDVLDALTIGAGTAMPGNAAEQVKLFTETLVLASRFVAQDVQISCHALACNDAAAVSVSPAPLPDFDSPQLAGPGAPGARGKDAQKILLLVESFNENDPNALPQLDAQGGRGQNGQHSQTDVGGEPGHGGNGGDVTVVYVSPYKRAHDIIQQALDDLNGPNARLILSALQAVPDQQIRLPSGKRLSELLAQDDPLIQAMTVLFLAPAKDRDPVTQAEFNQKLQLIIRTLATVFDTLRTHMESIERVHIYPRILNKAGRPGNYGTGPKGTSSRQPNGVPPTNGRITVRAVGNLSELPWSCDDDVNCQTLVCDMQAAMLLQKARMAYFYGDVAESKAARDTATLAKTLLDRLVWRLSFVDELAGDVTDPAGNLPRLKSVYSSANAYQKQFDLGLDYYGHPYGQVPLLSLEKYQGLVEEVSPYFADIETQYSNYFTYLIQNKAEVAQLTTASNKLSAARSQLEQDQTVLRETAGRIAFDVSSLTTTLAFKRDTLDTALARFTLDLNTYFNCDIKALISGLSTIAFAPESGAMWATQAAGWLYNGFTTIPDDSGEAINKDLIVQKVALVKADVDSIPAGFKQLNSGLFEADDPGANKLIAAEADLNKFLNDFQSRFKDDAQGIKQAFNDYVAAVIDRNNKIISYNAAISLLLKKKQQVADADTRQQDLETQLANDVSPALPSMTATMSLFYHAARDQLMETLYLMGRAYQFRALDRTNLIAKYMTENTLTPATLQSDAISSLYATSDSEKHLVAGIAWDWSRAQERMGEYPVSVFPNGPEKWGALYVFNDLQTLETFKQVRTLPDTTQVHSVLLTIPTVYRNSSADANALANMSDIRLTNVRAWLDGLRIVADPNPSPRLMIDVVHSGNESIVSPGNDLYHFIHATVTKFFSYSPDDLPSKPKDFPADAIFADSALQEKGDQPTYALIGPFTTWEVRLTNTYLERAGLLDALQAAQNEPGSYQSLQGREITCQYPSHLPVVGKIKTVTGSQQKLTLEIHDRIDRPADVLQIQGNRVTSEKKLAGQEIPKPNDAVSLTRATPGPHLDFSQFTAIRLEFSGRGRAFSVAQGNQA